MPHRIYIQILAISRMIMNMESKALSNNEMFLYKWKLENAYACVV